MTVGSKYIQIREAINSLVIAKQKLRDLGVIRSERFVGEVGEWFVATILEGRRAKTSSQKGWDLMVDHKRVQVKTHAKGDDNNARWTDMKYDHGSFDELVIVVFTKELYLKEFYQAPGAIIMRRMDSSGEQKVIKWDHLRDYQVPLSDLPHQEIVSLFVR